MTRATIAAAAFVVVLVLAFVLVLFGPVVGWWRGGDGVGPAGAGTASEVASASESGAASSSASGAASSSASGAASVSPPGSTSESAPGSALAHPAAEGDQGVLYGRVTTIAGAVHEGRLRWGRGEEAFWGDAFNGTKAENRWVVHVPPEKRPTERRPLKVFGVEVAQRERPRDLSRPFMVRFGDIARIEARADDVRVRLKGGSAVDLDRFEAGDFDDGVRVWDGEQGVVDVDSLMIRSIEFLPTPELDVALYRLHGTVHTQHGEFTGFIQWGREACVGTDELGGRSADGPRSVRFDGIRSIVRQGRDSSVVTMLDGRELVLSGGRDVGHGNRGIYVDDRRYGRVLVEWEVFERAEFNAAGSGPAYDEFAPGRPLTGSVTTRTGEQLHGTLVYDLDESETVETLDAPIGGVNYSVPFGMVASIVRGGDEGGRDGPGDGSVTVTLHGGEVLQLRPEGDLGDANAGVLIFVDEGRPAEYRPWAEVQRIDFDRS